MNKRYSLETRKTVLEMYQVGRPAKEIVLQTGVSRTHVYEWIKEANLPRQRKRSDGLIDKSTKKNREPASLPLAERKKLIDQFRQSENKTQFALNHHIPCSTLYRWSKQNDLIEAYDGTTINVKMYLEALRSNEKMQQIIEILQRSHCNASSSLADRMAEMETLTDQYSKRVLCSAFLVDRSTFYNHLNRNKRENTLYNARRNELKKVIEDIYDEHNQIPGIKKLRVLLQQKGYQVSERIIKELMKDLGISSIRNNAKKIYLAKTRFNHEINLKNMCPGDRPDQIWVSDFTCFRFQGRTYYVCIIMDFCSKRILAHKVGLKATTQMLTQCFLNAMALRKPTQQLIFHSDQGAQYTSHSFKELLIDNDVIQSFSHKGRPTDNAVMESFNSSFKQEELYRHIYLSVKQFKKAIASYIDYYNEKRPHKTLNGDSPVAFEQKFLMQNNSDSRCKS